MLLEYPLLLFYSIFPAFVTVVKAKEAAKYVITQGKKLHESTVEDGCYTWYMSVKNKVTDWYNMETGEALHRYKVIRRDELLQDVY